MISSRLRTTVKTNLPPSRPASAALPSLHSRPCCWGPRRGAQLVSFQKQSSATKSTVSRCLATTGPLPTASKITFNTAPSWRAHPRHTHMPSQLQIGPARTKHFSGGWGRNLPKTHERRGRRRRTSFPTIVSRFTTAPSRCGARDARGKRPPPRHRLARESDLPVEHCDLLSCSM